MIQILFNLHNMDICLMRQSWSAGAKIGRRKGRMSDECIS